jgi:hypothetical protein
MLAWEQKGREPTKSMIALFAPESLDGNSGFYAAISSPTNNVGAAAMRATKPAKENLDNLVKILKIRLDVFG